MSTVMKLFAVDRRDDNNNESSSGAEAPQRLRHGATCPDQDSGESGGGRAASQAWSSRAASSADRPSTSSAAEEEKVKEREQQEEAERASLARRLRKEPPLIRFTRNLKTGKAMAQPSANAVVLPEAMREGPARDHEEFRLRREIMDELWEVLRVTEGQRDEIAKLEQGTVAWLISRKLRLSASSVGAAVGNCGNDDRLYTTPEELANEMAGISPPPEPGTPAYERMQANFKHGHDHEPRACEAYESYMRAQREYQGKDPDAFKVTFCGLVVDVNRPWLGASPDGLIDEDGSLGVLEIKCPASGSTYPYKPAYYYDQTTLQMAILGREWCDFVVWTHWDWTVWRYKFDHQYWENDLLPRLEAFYFDIFLPKYLAAVVEGRVKRPRAFVQDVGAAAEENERAREGKPEAPAAS